MRPLIVLFLAAALAALTPEEILTVEPGADLHWPE